MPSYIELDKQASFPSSSNTGKMIFGVDTSNQATLTDSSGNTYNFGTGNTPTLRTYTVDLSLGDYTISGTGIVEVTNASASFLFFPDPSIYVGGTIVVVNTDTSYDISLGSDSNTPWDVGTNSTLSLLQSQKMYTFYSIGNKWRGGKLAQ